jgi:4-diphosphocytidyl-2-C-methyl-D-erythritol kinase
MAAGLGGGSSDAAAALRVAGRAWGLDPGSEPRLEAVLRLGADVPFFAAGLAVAAVTGIGDVLEPLPAPDPPAGVLLVTPTVRLATAAVFTRLDGSAPPAGASAGAIAALASLLRTGLDGAGLASAAASLRNANDLWAPAGSLAPGLAGARAALEAELGRPFLLSGSGTTLFAVYPSGAQAAAAACHLSDRRPAWLGHALVHATTTTQEGQSP